MSVRPGRRRDRWGFEVRVDGRLAVRVGGEEYVDPSRPESPRVINTWREYRFEEWDVPGSPVRTFAQLHATEDLQPVSYTSLNSFGQPIWTMRFTGDTVRARHADGTELHAAAGDADFLMEANGLVHLGVKLRDLTRTAKIPYAGKFFSPEALQPVPYSLEWEDPDRILRTNLDEHIMVKDGRLVGLTRPQNGLEVMACDFLPPRWPPRDSLGTIGPRLPSRVRPGYAPPPGVRIRESTTPAKGGSALGYTLAEPVAGRPRGLAIFYGGSGSHDRHGRTPDIDLGYHELLDQLSQRHGLASIRFDKRGTGDTPLGGDVLEYGFEGILDDARRCLAVAAEYSRDAGVPLLAIGHSEGGQVGLCLSTGHSQISGVILLATSAQPVDQVITDQVRRHGRKLRMSEAVIQAGIDEIAEFFKYVRQCDASEWTRSEVPDRLLARRREALYYRQLLNYDPLELIGQLRQPVLVLHGADDQQVPAQHARQLVDAARASGVDVTLSIVPRVNHLLKSSSADPDIADYYDRRRRVDRTVIDTIGSWLRAKIFRDGDHEPRRPVHREGRERGGKPGAQP